MAATALEVTLRRARSGDLRSRSTVHADPRDSEALIRILHAAVRGDGWDRERVPEFVLEVRRAGDREFLARVTDGG